MPPRPDVAVTMVRTSCRPAIDPSVMSIRERPLAVRSACSICQPEPSRASVPERVPVMVFGEPANAISAAASMPATLACHWNAGTSPRASCMLPW